MSKLSIIIPAYNEVRTIRAVLDKLRAVEFGPVERELVVVDDGSTDGTRELLASLPPGTCRVVLQERNQGKGAAVRRGLAEATGDWFAIQDADLEYEPGDYREMLEELERSALDIVFGSRFPGLNHWRPISHLQFVAHRVIRLASSLCSGVAIQDPTSCYQLFTRPVRDYLVARLRSQGFTLEVEIVALVGRGRFRYAEVPIHYRPRTYEEGKKIRSTDGLKILLAIARYNFGK